MERMLALLNRLGVSRAVGWKGSKWPFVEQTSMLYERKRAKSVGEYMSSLMLIIRAVGVVML